MSDITIFAPHGIFVNNKIEKGRVLIADREGRILGIDPIERHDPINLKRLDGVLTPGLINTHCHLELSHMKSKIDTGTTLLPFIKSVVKNRNNNHEEIANAIIEQDQYMYSHGIQAVGDISNSTDTCDIKRQSPISYYTFVEYFDLMAGLNTDHVINQYDAVYDAHEGQGKNKKSRVPHAPYSVSPTLFQYLNKSNPDTATVSIHNEETQAELDLFYKKSGDFLQFYSDFGNSLNDFNALGKSSIHYALSYLNPSCKILFVHNTLTTNEGIEAAQASMARVYWASCANANLYIENRLPNYRNFLTQNCKMTIGTDSLTSNWQLCVWEEIKTIKKYCTYIPIETLLTWATVNGAEALSMDDELGKFLTGKKPGIILLPLVNINDHFSITQDPITRLY